ncbi:MAG: prefoldin subunit alpha [archaeon GB-1867-035]|nr:prefoldin subunit alpha [Candidatus Culexmicrobium profundum]
MSTKELEARVNRLYLELNTLNSIAESLQRQYDSLSNTSTSIQLTLNTLKEIKNIRKGHEIYIPLGPSVYILVSILDNSNALLNVGAGVIIKKPISSIEEYLNDQLTQIQREQLAVQKKLQEVLNAISSIQAELNKLLSKSS